MISFKEFSQELLIVEAIKYTDRTLFRNIIDGKYEMSKKDLEKWENKQRLIKEQAENGEDEAKDEGEGEGEEERKYLQNDEEVDLIRVYQKNPTSKAGLDALNKLVENKMPYIYSKVGSFIRANWQYENRKDDMVQEASLALLKAIENFNPDSGNIFNAYASKYITGAIMNMNNTNRRRSIDNMKGSAGMIGSIDDKISGDHGTFADKDTTVGDSIADDHITSNTPAIIDDEERRAALADWISQLPAAEKTAIEMYFYPAAGQQQATLQQIGQKIGMSAMGVKKLLDRVTAKLKKFADDEGFND